jgi:hypothetical protein
MSRFAQRSSTKSYSSARPIESLEGRQMFTVTPAFIAPNTLTFVGDAANDTVNLYDNGNGGISGSYTNAGGTLSSFGVIPGIQNIRVSLGAGNDAFNYKLYGDMLMGGARYVNADLGKDNDVARFRADGDIDFGPNAYFDLGIQGSTGDDYIDASYDGELDGQLRLNFYGWDGNDRIVTTAKTQFGSTGVFFARSYGGEGDDSLDMIVRKENPFDTVSINAGVDGQGHVFGDKATRTPLAWDLGIEFLTVIP